MKRLKQLVRILDATEDAICFLACIVIFLIGLYALIDSYLVYRHANDTSLLRYKPGYEDTDKSTRKITGKMAAWLTIDGTNIDYPVMQGKDNEEYLNKDPYGDYSLSGSLFLDSRNQADFTDGYSLIYGHHMEGNHMFGSLHKYLKKRYFKKHQTGTLIVGDTTYDLQIFAVMNAKATQDILFSPTEYSKEEVIRYIRTHAGYIRKGSVSATQEDTRIVALSTCKYPDSVYRVIVFAKLTNPHPVSDHKR